MARTPGPRPGGVGLCYSVQTATGDTLAVLLSTYGLAAGEVEALGAAWRESLDAVLASS